MGLEWKLDITYIIYWKKQAVQVLINRPAFVQNWLTSVKDFTFSMDTGKHHLLQPAYGMLKKAVIYFSCVKYFQTFAFFPPSPVDLFSSY